MTVLDQLNQLIKELMYRREPISPVAVLGMIAFERLIKEEGGFFDPNKKDQEFVYQHPLGQMKLRTSDLVEPTSVSVNGRTIDDIVAEEILLGEDIEEG